MEKGVEHKKYVDIKTLHEAVVSFAIGGCSEFDSAVKVLVEQSEESDEVDGKEEKTSKTKKHHKGDLVEGSIDAVKLAFAALVTKKEQQQLWPAVRDSTLFAMMVRLKR